MVTPSAQLRAQARSTLIDLLERERPSIVEAGVEWIIEVNPEHRGERPRAETWALVDREFVAYRDLIVDGDPTARDAFIDLTTSFRASSEFRISTLLRSFLCFKRGVQAVIDRQGLSAELRLEIVASLDELYYETTFRMVDVYTDKLLNVIEHTQVQLMQREKMAALGGLVAGVAHEINTPMGVAVTAASLLQDNIRELGRSYRAGTLKKRTLESFISEADEAADLTLGNLRRAADLITGFKQIATDQTHTVPRRIRLGAYLREVVASLGPLFKRTPHRFELIVDESLEAVVDGGALSQILTNLVQNALLHAFPGDHRGVMSISLKHVASEDEDEDEDEDENKNKGDGEDRDDDRDDDKRPGRAELSFADNGVGIDESVMRRLFEPFFTTRRGSGGTGLGMHIVHTLVTEVLAGTITVDSVLGEGTTIRIRFPLKPKPAPADRSPH